MSTILKFAQRVNKVFLEIPVDTLVAMYEDVLEAEKDPNPTVVQVDKTCKYIFLEGKNANTRCKTKVKGGGDYCSMYKLSKYNNNYF
jgi:hypothetical protein